MGNIHYHDNISTLNLTLCVDRTGLVDFNKCHKQFGKSFKFVIMPYLLLI